MAFKKAVIVVEQEKGSAEINVLFNPAEYSLSEGANYSEKNIPGVGGPVAQYISGAASTLTMTLMFDTYQTNPQKPDQKHGVTPTDVSIQTEKITGLTRIVGALHRPPICTFKWGSLSFTGFVKTVNQTFTMFMEDGMPVRAKLEVTFQAAVDVKKDKQQTPFESPDRTKRRTVLEGVQLWNIAYEEYGDPGLWRVIAKENGILNPVDLRPGQVIKVPAL